jgi:hypothetical protein
MMFLCVFVRPSSKTVERTAAPLVYNYTEGGNIDVNIDQNLIVNTVTALNSPRTVIGSTSNKLSTAYLQPPYGRLFLRVNNCHTIKQQWNAVGGVACYY